MLDWIFDIIKSVFSLGCHPWPEAHYFGNFIVALLCPMYHVYGILIKAKKDQTMLGSIYAHNVMMTRRIAGSLLSHLCWNLEYGEVFEL